jgi:hypothetical protein
MKGVVPDDDGIVVFDRGLPHVGRHMMDATIACLDLDLYDVVVEDTGTGSFRLDKPLMLDPPEGTTCASGRPVDVMDMAFKVAFGHEIRMAIRTGGLDPVRVAKRCLQGRLADPGEEERMQETASAMAAAMVPETRKGDVHVCMRTPWTDVLIAGPHTDPEYAETRMPDMKGPMAIDVSLVDGDTLVISLVLFTVVDRPNAMEALRRLAQNV